MNHPDSIHQRFRQGLAIMWYEEVVPIGARALRFLYVWSVVVCLMIAIIAAGMTWILPHPGISPHLLWGASIYAGIGVGVAFYRHVVRLAPN